MVEKKDKTEKKADNEETADIQSSPEAIENQAENKETPAQEANAVEEITEEVVEAHSEEAPAEEPPTKPAKETREEEIEKREEEAKEKKQAPAKQESEEPAAEETPAAQSGQKKKINQMSLADIESRLKDLQQVQGGHDSKYAQQLLLRKKSLATR